MTCFPSPSGWLQGPCQEVALFGANNQGFYIFPPRAFLELFPRRQEFSVSEFEFELPLQIPDLALISLVCLQQFFCLRSLV